MNVDRRDLLIGTMAAAGIATATCVFAAVENSVSVIDYRRPEDRDDSTAFARAIATDRAIHIPAGRGSGRDGEYLVSNVQLRRGTRLQGDGIGRTVLRMARVGPGGTAIFYCDSGAPNAVVGDVRISDVTLAGWCLEQGFSEHRHLAHLNGVGNCLIERVEFKAFQGDGLYLGSGAQPDIERHNRNVTIRDCRFDGVNHENRNAISIIDGHTVLIEDCLFLDCTRANMPGAIDLEPDANPFAVIRNIIVRNCQFQSIGGNAAAVAIAIPAPVRLPTAIVIENNRFSNYTGTGAEISIDVGRRLTPADPDMAVRIKGNRGERGCRPYSFYAAKGLIASENLWQDYAGGSVVGFDKPDQLLRDASISDRFERCGSVSQVGLGIFNASNVSLDGSEFIDCGNGEPASYAIDFDRGSSEGISLRNVRVSSPTGRTRHAVMREAAHRFAGVPNRQQNNDFGGLPAAAITD